MGRSIAHEFRFATLADIPPEYDIIYYPDTPQYPAHYTVRHLCKATSTVCYLKRRFPSRATADRMGKMWVSGKLRKLIEELANG